jgi:hypothetical protein
MFTGLGMPQIRERAELLAIISGVEESYIVGAHWFQLVINLLP